MDREQADTFMKTKANRNLWLSETGANPEEFGKDPHRSKYSDGMLYVWWEKTDDEVQIFSTGNIYGECEDEIDLKQFNKIKPKSNYKQHIAKICKQHKNLKRGRHIGWRSPDCKFLMCSDCEEVVIDCIGDDLSVININNAYYCWS